MNSIAKSAAYDSQAGHLVEPSLSVAPEKVAFLEDWDEKYMIALPWIGAFLTVALWAIAKFGFDRSIGDVPVLLTTLIFMDSVHIIFTFVLILSTPELRAWSQAEGTRAKTGWMKGLKPWARTLVVAVLLGAVIYILRVYPETSTLRGMATIWLFLELLGPAHHTLSQMRGISFVYNSTIKKSFQFTDAEMQLALRCEKLERILFNALLVGEIIYWLPEIFSMDHIEIPNIEALEIIGGSLSIASAAALVLNALYFPKQEHSNKFAFLFRVVLFPLKMLSIVGGIFVRAAHGTEYLVIFRKMVKSSNIPAPKKTKVFVITALVSAIYAIPYLLTWPDAITDMSGFRPSDTLLAYALCGTFILRFAHYYLDSVLYKMSDSTTRSSVAPLLAPIRK
jgi:hypothetical protein